MEIVLISPDSSGVRSSQGLNLNDAVEGFLSSVWEQGWNPDQKILDNYGHWIVYKKGDDGTLTPQGALSAVLEQSRVKQITSKDAAYIWALLWMDRPDDARALLSQMITNEQRDAAIAELRDDNAKDAAEQEAIEETAQDKAPLSYKVVIEQLVDEDEEEVSTWTLKFEISYSSETYLIARLFETESVNFARAEAQEMVRHLASAGIEIELVEIFDAEGNSAWTKPTACA
jgi:hypothetical protein